ncbi:uncharacterized protein LOC132270735 [Cornus florida]|uniref:uncharacterized protein LOC132270735 n=1 Tax=Cornus florida TaxID=4283 RepID=UPI00289B0EE8|nr:uncharacterized protein LOC132270735 [Cornus florida]
MFSSGRHEHPQNFLQIKQEDKFFNRLLSKERTKPESSFRVLYYGGASSAIPFLWESRPGTPKHTLSHTPLPPLTPPPSYQSTSKMLQIRKPPKSSFLHSIFSWMGSRKSHVTPSLSALSSSSISSSCSSSYSSPSTPVNPGVHGFRRCFSHSRAAIHFGIEDNEKQAVGSPTSTLCFGPTHGISGEFGGQCSKIKVKKALLSMIGHGRA